MSWLSSFFGHARKARPIPGLTEWLVGNPVFRRMALGLHREKTEAMNDIDEYLEK